MPTEITPSDRVQLLGRGDLMHPGSCALCGSGNCDEGYVDTGVWYDYEGQVYFCMTCAGQIANAIGWFSPDEVAFIQSQNEGLATDNRLMLEELEQLRDRTAKFDSLYADWRERTADLSSSAPSDSVVPEQPDNDSVAEPLVNGADEGESTPEEPVTSIGRNDAARPKLRKPVSGSGESHFAV